MFAYAPWSRTSSVELSTFSTLSKLPLRARRCAPSPDVEVWMERAGILRVGGERPLIWASVSSVCTRGRYGGDEGARTRRRASKAAAGGLLGRRRLVTMPARYAEPRSWLRAVGILRAPPVSLRETTPSSALHPANHPTRSIPQLYFYSPNITPGCMYMRNIANLTAEKISMSIFS